MKQLNHFILLFSQRLYITLPDTNEKRGKYGYREIIGKREAWQGKRDKKEYPAMPNGQRKDDDFGHFRTLRLQRPDSDKIHQHTHGSGPCYGCRKEEPKQGQEADGIQDLLRREIFCRCGHPKPRAADVRDGSFRKRHRRGRMPGFCL